jgi:hypothetical protein
VAEGEEVLAVDRLNGQDYASGGDGSLLDVARGRWLHHMGRSVADGAVRVCQPIRMKVGLLESGAEEEKHDTEKGKHKAFARFRCPVLSYSSHDYPLIYSAEWKDFVKAGG